MPRAQARVAPACKVLASRSVIVTGAGGGIGAAIAVACARAGATRLELVGRSRETLDATALDVTEAGASATSWPCDLTDASELALTIGGVGPVDVLVNCAGANRPEPFLDVTADTLDWLWKINVRAVFLASQAAARRMIDDSRSGVIINISSQMGHVGASQRTAYCATKHAVEGLTKALAVELAPQGIRVVSVAPTFVRTPMTASQLDDPAVGQSLLSEIPLGRFALPEDVAAAVVFAASDEASFLTGSSLKIDGGWTAK
jgi:NAD(P)-dependent dehydrogenase (short-subunit alcohol dehydrogenase family)